MNFERMKSSYTTIVPIETINLIDIYNVHSSRYSGVLV